MTIVPDHHAKKKFEYIFNYYGTYASIFNYPKSVRDRSDQWRRWPRVHERPLRLWEENLWNVGGDTQITEYKVPDTPIKTLSVYSFPSSCAMNTSGDLAVGIFYGQLGPGGQVVIFKNGSGSGTVYTHAVGRRVLRRLRQQRESLRRRLYGDRSGFALVELPKGSTKFETITTSNHSEFPGSVQWDGTYLTVFDQDTNQIYRYTVSGTTATLKGTV